MGTFTTLALGTLATTTTAAIILRRSISRKWISLPPPPPFPSSSSTTSSTNTPNKHNDTNTNNNTKYNHHHFKTLTKNHIIVITGGNTGLGYETAKNLAQRGGNILLACRNIDSGNQAARKIRCETGNEHVSCRELDLASLDSVREFVLGLSSSLGEMATMEEDKEEEDAGDNNSISEQSNHLPQKKGIYALICNAGVWMPMNHHAKTQDGYELHFGVNHLGHFALIQHMMPLLQSSGMASRVILVSSTLLKHGKVDLKSKDFVHDGRRQSLDEDDDKKHNNEKKGFAPTGYCDSKLMNALTSRQLALFLQKEEDANNNNKNNNTVTSYSVSPGFCQSELGRNVSMSFFQKIFLLPIMRLVQRTTVQGAQNIIYVTIQDERELVNGTMYQDGMVAEKEMEFVESLGEDVQKGLWDLSLELIRDKNKA